MGVDRNWLTKLIQNELQDADLGEGTAHALASRLAQKLMSECDISPRHPGGSDAEAVQQAAKRGFLRGGLDK